MTTLKCEQALELFSPLIDGCISSREEAMLRDHLAECRQCADEFAFWNDISAVLKQVPRATCPDPDFSRSIINSIMETKEAQEQKSPGATRFAAWKKSLAAAAAAAFILAGSLGINAGMKGLQVVQHNPDGGTQTGNNLVPGDNDEKPGENTPADPGNVEQPPVAELEPGTGVNEPGDTEKPVGGPEPVNNSNPNRPVSNDNSKPAGGQNGGTAVAAAGNNEAQPVLLGSNMVIKSTVLKLAVNGTSQARDKAEEIAAAAGGSSSYLGEQNTGSGTVELVRITVPKEEAVKLVNSLAGLGIVISRQDEDRNITSQYNSLAARYNELLENGLDDQETAAQVESMQQQLDQWAKDAKAHTVVLWLQQK